jgi:hypothetical protein
MSQQLSQGAEGLAGCRLPPTAVKARADQGDGAEGGAEQKAAASFAPEVPTTHLTAPMPRQETRRLGRNEPRLHAGQHGPGLVKRQADLLELVITPVKAGNYVLAEHGLIIVADPELDLNSHGLSEAEWLKNSSLPAFRSADHSTPPHKILCSRSQRLGREWALIPV